MSLMQIFVAEEKERQMKILKTANRNRWAGCSILIVFFSICLINPVHSAIAPAYITSGVVWSPDGETLAVGTSDGVWLHEVDDLSQMRKLVEEPMVYQLAWHPTENVLAFSGETRTVFVVDVTDGEIVWEVLETWSFTKIAWSSDGTYLAVIDHDSPPDYGTYLVVFDTTTQQEVFRTPSNLSITLAWSPEGNFLYNSNARPHGGYFNEIWNVETSQLVMEEASGFFPSVIWSPNGEQIMRRSAGWLSFFDIGDQVEARIVEFEDDIFAGDFSPDGRRILFVEYTAEIYRVSIYDALSFQSVHEFPEKLRSSEVLFGNPSTIWSTDGVKIASVSYDGRIHIWDANIFELREVCECYAPQPYLLD